MMDPYTYRNRLTLPKLLVNGTNDPYWVVDAMSLYWDDLVGPKYILQVPNAGHGLDGGREHALATVAVFFRHVAAERPLPTLEWECVRESAAIEVTVDCPQTPKAARLWVAQSESKDFRESRWEPQPLVAQSDTYAAAVARPTSGHVACFGELQFEDEGVTYSLCTLVYRD
jgi:PhoPQ-activated pathogenicity-related protein